jgi:hypothetical protein
LNIASLPIDSIITSRTQNVQDKDRESPSDATTRRCFTDSLVSWIQKGRKK